MQTKTGINVAIHENADNERVIEFKDLSEFTAEFQTEHENGNIWGVYQNADGEIEAATLDGEPITKIIAE